MMRARFPLMVVLLMSAVSCRDLGTPSDNDVINQTGTVIQESAQSYVIRNDAAFQKQGATFYPLNLTEPFKRDGLRIRFSGNIEADPFAQYIYPPLRITAIEELMR
jgi:hypothetical protein